MGDDSKAHSFVKRKLDIRSTLGFMMEIEKFKNMFFDINQYRVFEHLPKPMLYDKDIYKQKSAGRKHKVNISLSHMEAFWRKKVDRRENYLLYITALENMKHKEKLDVIDERLLEMVEC